MKHVSFRSRALSFMTLVTLVSQIASPFLPTTYALNNSYYIDATDGSDLADGLSPATAWQTLSMASFGSGGYSEGDQILLECGESWNETLALSYSGAE